MIKRAIQASIDVKKQILEDENLLQQLDLAIKTMVVAFRAGRRVLFCGNGGSAADAQHLSAELSGRFYYDRPPLDSEALHCNTSYLTAVANDYGYDMVFARMLRAGGRKGDVLVGLSTSGNSENIVKAFDEARAIGIICIALTGRDGGAMLEKADIGINIASNDTPRIQEAHAMLGHILCEAVEATMFPRER